MNMISNSFWKIFSLLLILTTCWDANQLSAEAFDYRPGIPCSTDLACEISYGNASFCLSSGVCSNPYHSGCLKNLFPEDDQYILRHCNSHDDEMDNPKCRISNHLYPEINIYNQDWEVALFFSWIYQIVLSEVLNVPVRVGLGRTSANLTTGQSLKTSNFYNLETTLPIMDGPSYPWYAIRKANELGGDCSVTKDDCIHVIPDVWMGQRSNYEKEYSDGQIDYLDGNGQVGKVSWYVPKRTARRYPFTVTFLGLQNHRERLAEIFHRPVAWKVYCHEVSATNCSEPDEVALRYPETEYLGSKYFFSGGYIGHFRPTDKNNCTFIDVNAISMTAIESNLTCTGHIVNAKSTWSTFVEAQAYWNNIALESNGPDPINGGYAYDDIVDIWRAANATESDLISYFFEPDFASEEFRNTDYEYMNVLLPAATIQCRDSRVPPGSRSSTDPMVRRGVKEGSCDDNAHATKQVVAMSLRDNTMASSDAVRSPAYAFIRNFNMDELELSQLLRDFSAKGKNGHAAREAVCEWVGNNMDYISSFIPPSHPREVKARTNKGEVVSILAISVGAFAVVCVLLAAVQMYKKRKMKVFMYAQVKFIFVVLFGLFLVAIGSILFVIEPNDVVCGVQAWLVAMGFTCMLVPLIIKVSAMNKLMRASARMRRIRIKTGALYAKVLFWLVFVAIYLIIWTTVDPPRSIEMRTLDEASTTIYTEIGCMSSSEYWVACYLGWETILALAAFVLALQSRKAKAEFNESKSLGFMIYSHLGFAALRIIMFNVFDDEDLHLEAVGNSFSLSLDVIMAVTIYLVPKFYQCNEFEKATRQSNEMQGSVTVREIQSKAAAASTNFQRLRRNSIGFFFGAQQPFTEDTIEVSERHIGIKNSDRETGKALTEVESPQEQGEETVVQIERANEPTILEEDNGLSSSTSLRQRVTRSPTRRSPNSGESESPSGEIRLRPGFPRLASNRSSISFGSAGTRTSIQSRPSLAKSLSKYGHTSVRLLFGPTTELETIRSGRDFSGSFNFDDSEKDDLERISENGGKISDVGEFHEMKEGVVESSKSNFQGSEGGNSAASQNQVRTDKSDDSSNSVQQRNVNVMDA